MMVTFYLYHYYVVLCDGLSLPNGEVNYDPESINGEYPMGTIASFTCNYGYNLNGSNSRTCQISGNWTQKLQIVSKVRIFYTFTKALLHLYKLYFFK